METPEGLREYVRIIAQVTRNLLDGKIYSTGSVTLTANAASTTLSDRRIGPNSVIVFMPTTSTSAAGLTALYVTGRGSSTATINHANNAQTDRTYGYAVLG